MIRTVGRGTAKHSPGCRWGSCEPRAAAAALAADLVSTLPKRTAFPPQ